MKAQVIKKFGDPSVFEYTEVEKPQVKPGYVIIKVKATSVNQIDCKIRSGAVKDIAPAFPAILQGDVAGIVEEIGAGVSHFKKGDEVFGCAGGLLGSNGALAEYMLADANLLAKKPPTLSMQEAAALPLVGITAWEALFLKVQLKKGQHILIHGGVGGVGHIAIQLAKSCGAFVSTTVLKSEDFAIAKSYGADEVINAKEESVESYVKRLTNDKGFDVIFDTVGGPNLDKSFFVAKTNGIIVTTAARSTHDLSPMHNKALSLHVVFMLLPILKNEGRQAHGIILNELAALAEKGKVKPTVDPEGFSLEDAGKAHAWLESGKARGKVVVVC